jgi:hypothetical protein
LKTGNPLREEKTFFPVGSRAGYFTVLDRNENEIVMGEKDKHLNFNTSVFIDRENAFIYLTTIVHFNNILGKAYFIPVKPFHKLIIKSSLRNYLLRKGK